MYSSFLFCSQIKFTTAKFPTWKPTGYPIPSLNYHIRELKLIKNLKESSNLRPEESWFLDCILLGDGSNRDYILLVQSRLYNYLKFYFYMVLFYFPFTKYFSSSFKVFSLVSHCCSIFPEASFFPIFKVFSLISQACFPLLSRVSPL